MEDQKLIELFWSREPLAISETAKAYGGFCHTIAYRILADHDDAEECENDTWLAAWNSIPPSRPSVLRAFLGRLTRNIALNRYDRKMAQKRGGGMEILLSELGECISTSETVESAYAAHQIPYLISAFLREMDEIHRSLFLQRYWFCASIAELARQFGMTQGKVKTLLFRMRLQLKGYLGSEGIEV